MLVPNFFQAFLHIKKNFHMIVCWLSNCFECLISCSVYQCTILIYCLNMGFVYLEQCRCAKLTSELIDQRARIGCFFESFNDMCLNFSFWSIVRPKYLWNLMLENSFLLVATVAVLSLFMVSLVSKSNISILLESEFTCCRLFVLVVRYNALSSANNTTLLCLQPKNNKTQDLILWYTIVFCYIVFDK